MFKTTYGKYTHTELCRIFPCIGCCGTITGSRTDVEEAIRKNTAEFNDDLIKFRDRSDQLRKCGVCRNLIYKDNEIICPLHPAINGKDLREGHCDILYLCQAAQEYNEWSATIKEQFISFLKSKNLDWYQYSVSMDNGMLLREFKNFVKFSSIK